jgi:hypothetical protein
MIVVERHNLTRVKTLIDNSLVHLVLLENEQGNIFVSSDTTEPEGTIYFATTPSLFCMFLENQIDLQNLFNDTPSHFVEISTKDTSAVYSVRNTDIELKSGDKKIRQLTSNCPIEIW